MRGLKRITRCPAISARRSLRIISSLLPLNIGPQTTSIQPPRCGGTRITAGTLEPRADEPPEPHRAGILRAHRPAPVALCANRYGMEKTPCLRGARPPLLRGQRGRRPRLSPSQRPPRSGLAAVRVDGVRVRADDAGRGARAPRPRRRRARSARRPAHARRGRRRPLGARRPRGARRPGAQRAGVPARHARQAAHRAAPAPRRAPAPPDAGRPRVARPAVAGDTRPW